MEGIQEAKHYGTSKSVELTFRDKEAFEKEMKYSFYVCYCRVKWTNTMPSLNFFFKCHKFDTLQQDLPNNENSLGALVITEIAKIIHVPVMLSVLIAVENIHTIAHNAGIQ